MIERAFSLTWRNGAYYVDKPNIGNTDCYTKEQLDAARAQALEEAAELIDAKDRETLARQQDNVRPDSMEADVNRNLRLTTVLLPDLSAAIRQLKTK